ncbi:MAG TPA: triose-phosphate isomerase [Gaiellaceae bacterium]|nr:triose-phosphate isomerase [Gaiellaceae bacterium]
MSKLIAGNWKMFKGPGETARFTMALHTMLAGLEGVDVVVAPPCVSLGAAVAELRASAVRVYAQNVHWEAEGAFTGEVSAPMLVEAGVAGAIVGHSERRQHFAETDETTARRAHAALGAGLGVIACVGETLEEREAGETEAVLRRQIEAIAAAVPDPPDALDLAYEPVWAIGTGRTATPEIAQEAHAFVRGLYPVGRILYGGSVKPDNAEELLAQPDVDGALVGGASLDADSFAAICLTAARFSRS